MVCEGASVGPGSQLRNAFIGPGAVIGAGAVVTDSVLMGGAVVGAGARLEGALLLPGARVKPGCLIERLAVRIHLGTDKEEGKEPGVQIGADLTGLDEVKLSSELLMGSQPEDEDSFVAKKHSPGLIV